MTGRCPICYSTSVRLTSGAFRECCEICSRYLDQPGVGIPPLELQCEADIHENAGRFQEAMDIYLNYLQEYPRSAFAYNNIAALYMQMRQPAKAAEAASKAVDLLPTYVKAWNNVGAANATLGNLKGAKTAFEMVLRLDPSNLIAKNNLATLSRQEAAMHPGLKRKNVRSFSLEQRIFSAPSPVACSNKPHHTDSNKGRWRSFVEWLTWLKRCANDPHAQR